MLVTNITPLYTNSSQPFTGLLFLNPVGSSAGSNGIITIQFQDGYITEGYTNIPFTSEGFNLDVGDYCAMWLFGNPDILITTPFVCDKIIQIDSVNSVQDIFNDSISSEIYSLSDCIEENKQLSAQIESLKCCIDNLNIINQNLENTISELEQEIDTLNSEIDILKQDISELENIINQLQDQINQLQDEIDRLNEENDLNSIKGVILEAKNNPINKIKKENYNNGTPSNNRKINISLNDIIHFIEKKPTEVKKLLEYKDINQLFKHVPKEILSELKRLEKLEEEKIQIKSKINYIIENSKLDHENNKITLDSSSDLLYNNSINKVDEIKKLIQEIKNNG